MFFASLAKLARHWSLLAGVMLVCAPSAADAANVYYGANPGQLNFTTAAWVDNANPPAPVPAGPGSGDTPIINTVDGLTDFPYIDSAVAVQRFTIAELTGNSGGLEIRSGGNLTTSLTSTHYVGARGAGYLRILPGGTLNINGTLQVGWGDVNGRGSGTVTQSGGTYIGTSANTGIWLGNSPASEQLAASTGTYNMNGGSMDFGGPLVVGREGIGVFNMKGGTLSTSNYIQIARNGTGALVQTAGTVTAVRAEGDALVVAPFAAANGSYVISGGSLNVTSLDGVGGVAIGVATGDSNALFKVIGNSPTITFNNNFLQHPNAMLGYEIGADVSPINVGANATLGGKLDVKFGSTPSVGQEFTIMNYAGSLTGTFASFDDLVDSPAGADTVKLSIDYGAGAGSAIVLKVDSLVSAAVPGDFNADGNVNGADLAAWKTNFPIVAGATVAKGDADADADVDGADFLIWQRNYTGPGISPVPEPAALFLATAIGLVFVRRRR